ncbi:MAG: stage II sporulation protein P [Eubacterium sp.]|nr:stage II sporulation protein P [Eubacterium sp.]
MQRGIRKNTNRILLPNMIISQSLIQSVMKGIIIILCLYIAIKCVNLITGDRAKEVSSQVISDTSKMLAKEIVENGSVMSRYMLYIENHGSMTEAAKKEVLDQIVSDYINHSEYTYDTSDPGYQQVVNLIYENAGYVEEETTAQPKKEEPKKKTKPVKAAANVIVPMPKLKGKLYTANNIGSFDSVINKFYIITAATSIKESDMPIKAAMNEKFKIKGNNKKPQILIYHTHSQEEFSNSNGNESTTIIGVGDRLARILEDQFGYNVIHDKSTYDIVDGKLDRNEAYDQSRVGVKKILDKYPSISLILDIHRDGVNEDTRLVTEINGKKTAQVMFFNGMSRFKTTGNIDYLYNPYLYENLALSLQMKVNAEAYYPGFARHNYVNAYKYNLDLCKQSMLIEVGAQTNTYQEVRNAAEPLARLIDIVMGKKK